MMNHHYLQIDINCKIRTGKIMQYKAFTAKKIKGDQDYITWVHSAMKLYQFNSVQCLFDEHQLRKYNGEIIGVVEGEKTAIIASGFYLEMIWIFYYNLKGKHHGHSE